MAPPRKPTDVSTKERNEYIPSFIANKPFYATQSSTVTDSATTTPSTGDYLEHQRKADTDSQTNWYDRGKRLGPASTKYRKGACENCGAITHKTKECLSRPRKQGAKWTGRDIAADELVQDVKMGWDAKRDRWNGYDAAEYKSVVEDYERIESLKREAAKAAKAVEFGDDEEEALDADAEEAKYQEESDMGRQQSNSTRQLRIREDTAKYLLNLDLDSARYDPKTRAMVDSGATADTAAALVAEEGFVRAGGDAAAFEQVQRLAWETQQKGRGAGGEAKMHLQANPTEAEVLRKKAEVEAEKKKAERQRMLQERYGVSHVVAANESLQVTESESYAEYDESGLVKQKAIEGAEGVAKSSYVEDVYINNHTSVWGSWWFDCKWGYSCCHSFTKRSYCTGEQGIRAREQEKLGLLLTENAKDVEQHANDPVVDEETSKGNTAGEDEGEVDAMAQARQQIQKKRTLQEMQTGMDEAELDAYRRKRNMAEDPMAGFLNGVGDVATVDPL